MVPAVNHVNGGVHFNAADFGSCQILLVVNVMNVVVLNDGEHAAQMTNDSSLSTGIVS
jgi:hypothetical protein